MTPEALNALPGWSAVAFFLFWVIKALLDVIKNKQERSSSDKAEKSDKTEKSDDVASKELLKELHALAVAVGKIEVRLDNMEASTERLDDRLADALKELGRAQGPR